MASMTMTPSFAISKQLPATAAVAGRRGTLVVRASKVSDGEQVVAKSAAANGRRDLVFAAAAAAACTLARVAMAEEVEPKSGTTEARKKYAPVCITMPTAKICHR